MKRKYLGCAILAMFMTSCSNDDVVDNSLGSEITFRTITNATLDKPGKKTRGNSINDLDHLTAFKVSALKRGETGTVGNFFTDMTVTNAGDGTWTNGEKHYWPSYALDFYAYAPTDVSGVSVATGAADGSTKVISAFTPSSTVAEQKDLMVAANLTVPLKTKPVPLHFKHALTQIEIKAKCGDPNIRIKVKGVKIVNVHNKGDFRFPTATSGASTSFGTWTSPTDFTTPLDAAGTNSYILKAQGTGDIVTLGSSPASIMFGDNNFMLIPQNLTSMGWDGTAHTNGAYIAVFCNIYNISGNQVIYPEGMTENDFAYSAVPVTTYWKAGKKYIYTLDFCGTSSGAGEVDPNANKPADPDDKTPSDKGGKEILESPISFSVTMDNWTDEELAGLMK